MQTRIIRIFIALVFLSAFSAAGNAAPGDLDLTFNGTGKVTTDVSAGNNVASATAIQADGKIVVTGTANNGTINVFSLVRYNADGSLDTSLDGDGILLTALGTTGATSAGLTVQPDGKILVLGAGAGSSGCLIVRYNPNGSLDTTFSGDGIAQCSAGISVNVFANTLTMQTDGKIIIGGSLSAVAPQGTNFAVQRLNADGSPDLTFGTIGNGTATVDFGGNEIAYGIAVRPDGKIAIAGYQQVGMLFDFAVAVLNANGSLDTSFSDDGKVITSAGNLSQANAVAAQSDNKIIAAGFTQDSSGSDFGLARYNTDGSLDASFDGDGIAATPFLISEEVQSIKVAPDGKIIAAGYTTGGGGVWEFAIVRYNSNGSLDTTFSGDGKQTIDFGTGVERGYSLSIDQSGRYVIAGDSNNLFAVTRVLGDSVAAPRVRFDFDGDGKADVSVFRPSGATWYLQQSTSGFTGIQFGISSDKIVPADYDGDGKTDVAVFRNGIWYLQRSQLGFTGIQFGLGTDIPVPADYDGDGKADLAVFREANGTWYIQQSQAGFTAVNFGLSGDKPVAADYDGDAKADVAVFRGGVWYIQRSQLGFTGIQFGIASDKTVPADYDGDGKTDLGVFRDGTWYLQRSQLGFTGIGFGLAGDKPVAADYDGDGKADVAVFRSGTWYLNRSTAGFTGVAFGVDSDKPIPNAFVQ